MLRLIVYALAAIVLLVASALAAIRVLLPNLQHFRPEIVRLVSRTVEQRVELGAIDAHWQGWTPVLRIEDVRLTGEGTDAGPGTGPAIRLAELVFSIDPLDSLRSGELRVGRITARGASLAVVRRSDGGISIRGLGTSSSEETRGGGRLLLWALGRSRISLLSSSITWIDEQGDTPAVPLRDVALHLDRDGVRYRFSGSLGLPDTGRIAFTLDSIGQPFAESWSGTAFGTASDIDLELLDLIGRGPNEGRLSGRVSGELWSTWNRAGLVEAEGSLHARSVGVTRGQTWRGFDDVRASFKVARTSESWILATRDLVIDSPNGSSPASSADVKWTPSRDGRDGAVVVQADYARIEDLLTIVSAAGETPVSTMPDNLGATAATGVIEDLHVSAPITGHAEFGRARARGRFRELGLVWEPWPVAIESSSGSFEASEQGLVAEFANGSLRASNSEWLAEPLRGERFEGALAVFASPEGTRVRISDASVATQAGTVSVRGALLAPRDGHGPEGDLTLELGETRIASVRALVADRALPKPLWRWIDAAAPEGVIRGAKASIRGRLSEPWLESGSGAKLEVTADLASPTFQFAPGWPEVMDLSGILRINGPRLDARIESGRIFGAEIRECGISIDDLAAPVPVVRVAGKAAGSTADGMRFLAESPLRAQFAPIVDRVAVDGDGTLDLEVSLPLKGGHKGIIVTGEVVLDHNRLQIPGLNRAIEAVTGVIAFRHDAVESEGITATWDGEPIHAFVGPSPAMESGTRVTVNGRLTRRLLAGYLDDAGLTDAARAAESAVLARLDGASAWKATLDIPHTAGGGVRLRIASDLSGISLDLPPPFDKTSEEAREIVVDTSIAPDVERITEVRVGTLASALLRFVPDHRGYRFERGMVRLDAGPPMFPDTAGLSVRGVLPAIDISDWLALRQDFATDLSSSIEGSSFDERYAVSIDAGTVKALGTEFPETRIQAARGAGGAWRVELAGDRLEGVVTVPRDVDAEPISADFERFIFKPSDAGSSGARPSPDPRSIPALSLSARQLVLDEHDIGGVRLHTIPSEDGMQIDRLDFETPSFDGDASGSWSLTGTKHRTDLNVRIYGDDLGQMLASLGFDGTAATGGETDISLRGSWDGSPADFALERLRGVMHVHSSKGRLTQVERGIVGRVFGLFAIPSLPRRLILDFSDLFEDGVEYDLAEGSFALENGDAFTDNLLMDSDTARVQVVGRTGLVTKDYDQVVTIVPKIASTLPFAPVWVVQKILDQDILDKAFSYRYRITGTWAEPNVELVTTEERRSGELE